MIETLFSVQVDESASLFEKTTITFDDEDRGSTGDELEQTIEVYNSEDEKVIFELLIFCIIMFYHL